MANANETRPGAANTLALLVAWLWVGVPLAWGVYMTVLKASALFM